MLRTLRKMHLQPFLEQIFYLVRQAQEYVAGLICAGIRNSFNDRCDLRVVNGRDYWRNKYAGRNTLLHQGFYGFEPRCRRRHARFHNAL